MPKYTVAVTEVIQYLVPVEADNEEDAEEMGSRMGTNNGELGFGADHVLRVRDLNSR